MQNLSYILIPLLITVVIAGMNKEVLKAEKDMNENNFIICQSRILLWVCIILTLLFGVGTVAMLISQGDADKGVFVIFFFFTLICLCFAMYSIWEYGKISDRMIR